MNQNKSGDNKNKTDISADDLIRKLSDSAGGNDNLINVESDSKSDSALSIDDLLQKYLDEDTIAEIYSEVDEEVDGDGKSDDEAKADKDKTADTAEENDDEFDENGVVSGAEITDTGNDSSDGEYDFLNDPDFDPDEFTDETDDSDSGFDETTWDYGSNKTSGKDAEPEENNTADGEEQFASEAVSPDESKKIIDEMPFDVTHPDESGFDFDSDDEVDIYAPGSQPDRFEDQVETKQFSSQKPDGELENYQPADDAEPVESELKAQPEADAYDVGEGDAAGNESDGTQEDSADVDDTDITLMYGLGLMDDENKKKFGEDKVKRVEENIEKTQKKHESLPAFEFNDRSQIKKIGDSYKYAQTSTKVKLIIAAVFALMLLVFENITIIGKQFAGALDPSVYPIVYIMADLQLLLLCCAAAYDSILDGIGAIFKGKPTPESLTSLMVIVAVVSTVITACTVEQPYEPVLFNFPVAITIVMTLVFRLYNIRREIFSFNVIATKRPKFALRHLDASESQAESGIFAADGLTEANPDVLCIDKTSFIDGYFRRTADNSASAPVMAIILPVVAAVYALFFAFSFFLKNNDAAASASVAYSAALFCFPLSVFFTYSIPFFKADKTAFEMDSTIIGEGSLNEYSGAEIISFEDKNVFPSYNVRVKNINIYDNNYIEKIFYYASSVFMKLGGPLADVFEVATRELEHTANVNVTENSIGFLSATIDDGASVIFAKHDALTSRGYNIPAEVWDDSEYSEDDVAVMYMLIDGKFAAKMYIKYIIDSDFEFILKQLRQNGMCVGVKTFDPNIDEEMIGKRVKMKKYPLRVIKNTVIEEAEPQTERSDSGIVSRSNTKSLLQTVTLCDKVLQVYRTNLIIKALSIVIALVIAALVMISGTVYDLKSLYIAVYQLFWLLPVMLTTRIFI